MSSVDEVAIRLAERVAPDEVELAPAIAEAAAAGGSEWRRLQQPGGAMHGGVIPGTETLGDLVVVIGAVKECASLLASFCLIGSASLSIVLSRSALREKVAKLSTPGTAPADQAAADRATVERTVEAVLRELGRRGLAPDRAEQVADQVLTTLAENPAEGREFAEALGQR